MPLEKPNHDRSLFWELVRFVVVGVYATVIDFAVEGWATSMLSNYTEGLGHVAAFFAMFGISVIGFIIATPANWSLNSVWAFRNVEAEAEKKARSLKGVLIFTFWSAMALLFGALIQFLGYMICLEWSGWDINILGGFNFDVMFKQGHYEVFFAWAVVLVIRTAFTMVFNYVTRKVFIYKAPKETK
jgi:putative flippase GtrA